MDIITNFVPSNLTIHIRYNFTWPADIYICQLIMYLSDELKNNLKVFAVAIFPCKHSYIKHCIIYLCIDIILFFPDKDDCKTCDWRINVLTSLCVSVKTRLRNNSWLNLFFSLVEPSCLWKFYFEATSENEKFSTSLTDIRTFIEWEN